jgi:hypothetical protein
VIAAGCRHIQLEDLGAWMPFLSGDQDYAWVNETVDRTMRGIDRRAVATSWHFCMGNAWGNQLEGMTAGGYRAILPRYLEVAVDEYVLDFACREMADADLVRQLPADKRIAAGVIDVRTLEIEHPEQVAERIRKLLRHIEPERVTLTTDCGLKQLPRPVRPAEAPGPWWPARAWSAASSASTSPTWDRGLEPIARVVRPWRHVPRRALDPRPPHRLRPAAVAERSRSAAAVGGSTPGCRSTPPATSVRSATSCA